MHRHRRHLAEARSLHKHDGAANGHAASPAGNKREKGPPLPALLLAFLGSLLVLMVAIWNLPNETSQDTTRARPDDVMPVVIERLSSEEVTPADKKSVKSDPELSKPSQDVNLLSEPKDVDYHMVFSTGCSVFQDWQSYMFFFHAMKVGQPGHVTRIVSGCKPDEEEALRKLYKEQIATMSDRFHIHFTPDFTKMKPGFRFKYFNKPFGMLHWLENGLGYPNNTEHDDCVVILMDPDQILIRPITNDFRNATILWKKTKAGNPPKLIVDHGSPFGQLYGFGAQWMTKVKVLHVTNGEHSPIENMTMPEARDYYPVGPPYIATARDMYKIVTKWTKFVPRIHDDYPHLLAEMFAYSFASAHVGLPHTVSVSFMVSDAYAGGIEGWKLVDPLGRAKVCQHPPRDQLPYVLHYCQRYMLGKWFIGKYRLPKDFISCKSPMLKEPPSDVGLQFDFSIGPGSKEKNKFKYEHHITRNAFMLCHMIPALNEAAEYFKKHNCGADANYEKTLFFHDTMEID